MTARIRDMAPNLVHVLGKRIPEFEFREISIANETGFAHACLLVNQIMNQITMYNAGLLNLRRDLIVDQLANNFIDYVLQSPVIEKPQAVRPRHPKIEAIEGTKAGSKRKVLAVGATKNRETAPLKKKT